MKPKDNPKKGAAINQLMKLRGDIVGLMAYYKRKLDKTVGNDARGMLEKSRKEYAGKIKDLEETLKDVDIKIEIYNGTYGQG